MPMAKLEALVTPTVIPLLIPLPHLRMEETDNQTHLRLHHPLLLNLVVERISMIA